MKPEEAAFRVMYQATKTIQECGELVIIGGRFTPTAGLTNKPTLVFITDAGFFCVLPRVWQGLTSSLASESSLKVTRWCGSNQCGQSAAKAIIGSRW
jgi:hypothetical protein